MNEFTLKIIKQNNIEIEEGVLTCKNCRFSTTISEGIVNLLFNLDSDTLKEANLHIKDRYDMFEKELKYYSLEELEKRWAYMEQESSKDYGLQVKKIFNKTIEESKINKHDIILDLGAGTGWSTAQLAKISEYCIAVDLCKPIKLELSKVFLKDGIFFERCLANMMQLPIADGCIDLVTSVASLHHVTNLADTMYEISRVLKNGGKLILIGEPVIPRDYLGTDKEFINQKKKGFNEHQYTAYDWFKACESAGLYAIDGTTSHDNLDKYYEVNKDSIQNPLPVFVKQKKDANKNLKIALLSQEFSKNCNGGVCRYTYDLAHALAESGNEVHVITRSEKNYEYEYEESGVFIHKIIPELVNFINLPEDVNVSKKNLSYSYSACLKLLNLIDNFGIQIAEAPLWDSEGFVFSLVKSIPLIIRLETPLFKVAEIQNWQITKDLKLANWMEGETARKADKTIAISKDIGTLIGSHHNISEERIDLCPLGIEVPDENLLISDQKKNGFNILFVGRLEKRKGVETLFNALPMVLEKIPDTQFYLVGADTNLAPDGGSYKKYLLKNLDKKFHKNVKFIGYVDDMELKTYYNDCDLFVAPSLYESFGLIFLEAMAWGKPVIGCNIGGIPEIVEDGNDGILIQPDDEKSLADAIIKLLTDKYLRVKMGVCGRKKVENSFSMEKMTEITYNIYKRLIYG